MSSTPTEVSAGHVGDHRLKRHIGMLGLLFTAVGSIIGSGWLFGAMNAAEQAGPASIFSWIFGAIMIMFIALVYAELSCMFPVSGGVVRFPNYSFGRFASFTTGWITYFSVASVAAVEVEAALQYANNYVPWLQHIPEGGGHPVLTTAGAVVAALMLGLFNLINLFGVRWFARINNAAVWWKLGVIVLVVIAFLSARFEPAHFTDHGFAPMGWHGVFSAIATAGVVFSYFGFRQGTELAGETDNPQRNVPIALIGSILICGLIYIGLQVAFIGSLPSVALSEGWAHIGVNFTGGLEDKALAFGPLAVLAATMGMAWLAMLLYIDAFISPADTGMIYTVLTTRISYGMARNGDAPKALGKVNKQGVPWVGLIVGWVIGCIFFLPFPGWASLVGFVTAATVLSFGTGPVVLMAMRKELGDRKRPFRLGGGWTIPFLAFFSSNLIIWWSGWDKVWKLMALVLVGLIIFGVYQVVAGKNARKMDLKAGFWQIPWLVGLTIISWLGNYPEVTDGAGNLGMLHIGGGVIVIAIFSALIMWMAQAFRLPRKQVLENIHQETCDEGGTAETL